VESLKASALDPQKEGENEMEMAQEAQEAPEAQAEAPCRRAVEIAVA
jgi:hypothetical protein